MFFFFIKRDTKYLNMKYKIILNNSLVLNFQIILYITTVITKVLRVL